MEKFLLDCTFVLCTDIHVHSNVANRRFLNPLLLSPFSSASSPSLFYSLLFLPPPPSISPTPPLFPFLSSSPLSLLLFSSSPYSPGDSLIIPRLLYSEWFTRDASVLHDLTGHVPGERAAVRKVCQTAAAHEPTLVGEHFGDHQLVR